MKNYSIFRLFDYETGSYVGPEFSSLTEFFTYHHKTTFKNAGIKSNWRYIEFFSPVIRTKVLCRVHGYYHTFSMDSAIPGKFNNQYAIKNEYGKSYKDPDELFRLACNRGLSLFKKKQYTWGDWNDSRTYPLKKNINKMKPEWWSWYFRGLRTYNECRQNDGHINEYRENFVRSKRRHLPSSWDDRPISAWKTRRNWKHNSKRKHQWKKK